MTAPDQICVADCRKEWPECRCRKPEPYDMGTYSTWAHGADAGMFDLIRERDARAALSDTPREEGGE